LLSQSLYFSATDGSVFIWAINAVLGDIRRMVSLKDQFCLLVFPMSVSMTYLQLVLANSSMLMISDCLPKTALEDTLSEDLNKVSVFLSKWRLQPNVA